MARAKTGLDAKQQGTKRKRLAAEPVDVNVTSEATPEDDVPSESGASEQSEELMLDSFDKDIAEPLEAFHDAVTSTTAFLQPSEQLSILARSAAKVCHFHQCAFAAGQAESC